MAGDLRRSLVLLPLTALPLHQIPAQQQAPWSVGVFGAWVNTSSQHYATARTGVDGAGLGGRFSSHWGQQLQGEISVRSLDLTAQPGTANCPITRTDGCAASSTSARATLLGVRPVTDGFALHVGGGPEIVKSGGARIGTRLGAHLALGISLRASERTVLRVDLVGSWAPPSQSMRSHRQWEGQVGVQWRGRARCDTAGDSLTATIAPDTLRPGERASLTITAPHCGGVEEVAVASLHPDILEVSKSESIITALRRGTAQILVRGLTSSRVQTITVIVTPAANPETTPPEVTPDGDPIIAMLAPPPISFAFDRSDLTREGQALVRRWYEALPTLPRTGKILVVGHTDHRGPAAYNRQLGQRRAEVVARELTRLGVSGDRLYATSAGETEPIVAPGAPEGPSRNRRVEIRRIPR